MNASLMVLKRMRHSIILSLFLVLVLFCPSCKSEEEKALDAAIASNSLSALRNYSSIYGESLVDKVKARFDLALNQLVTDSTLYAAIVNAESVLDKYSAANNYIKELPAGLYLEEAEAVVAENKDRVEKMKEALNQIRKSFELYDFKRGSIRYVFTGPDESGKGTITGTGPNSLKLHAVELKSSNGHYVFTWDKDYIKGDYYIDEDLLIHASTKESYDNYSIGDHPNPGQEHSSFDREKAIKAFRSLRTNKSHKMIMTFDYNDGDPYLFGKEQGRSDFVMSSVLK